MSSHVWRFLLSIFLMCHLPFCPPQILIELETALLDDIPHWYKLQTHDVSSIPLPQPSPYLPRRHVHGDSPSRKLQSMCVHLFAGCVSFNQQCLSVVANISCSEPSPVSLSAWGESLNLTLSCVWVFCVCVCMCAGSHRIIDTEFDDGLIVVTKGGWGSWLLSVSS